MKTKLLPTILLVLSSMLSLSNPAHAENKVFENLNRCMFLTVIEINRNNLEENPVVVHLFETMSKLYATIGGKHLMEAANKYWEKATSISDSELREEVLECVSCLEEHSDEVYAEIIKHKKY